MKIIGVDFSGAGGYNTVGNTWIARGELNRNRLTLNPPHPISRADLTEELANLDKPAVAAMDFPFSVPAEFARFWQPDARQMPDLWAAMEWANFSATRDEFVGLRWEQKRHCDPPESKSPLKRYNPDMRTMTFRGMQMLNRLWRGMTVSPVMVPPLPQPNRPEEKEPITLLEVMPGAVLRSLGLPFRGYKVTTAAALEMRRYILNELPQRINPLTVNLPGEVYDICLNNDDALDAVVAAITAALWVNTPDRFPQPPAPERPEYQASLLEGWLFKPYQMNEPAAERE